MEALDFLTIMSIAFIGSFGHCIGMCGGIVMAYSSIKIEPSTSKVSQSMAHLLYSFGRVLSYTSLGVLFGALGQVVSFSGVSSAYIFIFLGLSMVIVSLSLLGLIRPLVKIEEKFSSSSLYKKYFKKILHSHSNGSFFLLGVLNGLLPCGFVYFFSITAVSSASPLYGALVMFIFGVSTIPALFGLGFITTLLKATRFRGYMVKIAALSVLIYGLMMVYNGSLRLV